MPQPIPKKDHHRNTHIWYVSLERAETVWEALTAFQNREISKDDLRERLLRLGLPRNIEPGDDLQIRIVKRVQSNGARIHTTTETR